MPVVPALVQQVVLGAGATSVDLRRAGDTWRLKSAPGEPEANAVEVRRLLRDLSALAAIRRIEGAALDPADVAGSVSIAVPGMDREAPERLLVQIGRPGAGGAGPGEVALVVESTRIGAIVPGRALVRAEAVAGLAPDAARFTGAAP